MTQYQPTTRRISTINFGLISPEEAVKRSVLEITSHETTIQGQPKPGGLSDPLMGTTDHNTPCETCGFRSDGCPGHFGHLNLVLPVPHPCYLNHIVTCLQSTCHRCFRLLAKFSPAVKENLLNPNNKWPADRLEATTAACSMGTKDFKVCPHCPVTCDDCGLSNIAPEAKQCPACKNGKTPTRVENYKIGVHEGRIVEHSGATKEDRRVLDPREVLTRLKSIDDESMRMLAFDGTRSRPEWLMLHVLPVPPPCIRPSAVIQDQKGDHDITKKLTEIVKANTALGDKMKSKKGGGGNDKGGGAAAAMTPDIDEAYLNVVANISSYMINDKAITSANSGGAAGGRSTHKQHDFEEYIKGKDGDVRGSLCGKRADKSSRTVITPDPNIALHQLAIPPSFAMTIPFEEHANPRNLKELQEAVDRGPDDPEGAILLRKADGEEIELRTAKPWQKVVTIGDIVDRPLKDGDPGMFNRQPSLHKCSMMGHEVVIINNEERTRAVRDASNEIVHRRKDTHRAHNLPPRMRGQMTFGLNLSVTTPYNGDFDGDEMNFHVAENDNIASEIRQIMMVWRNIVSPQANRPVIAMVQDTVLGLYKLTQPDLHLSRDEVFKLAMHIPGFCATTDMPEPRWPGDENTPPMWDGAQVVSMALPPINVRAGGVVIQDGKLVSGRLTKKSVGCVEGGLVHIMFNDLGGEECAKRIFTLQKMATQFLLMHGVTLGMDDVMLPKEVRREIRAKLDEGVKEAHEMRKNGKKRKAQEILDSTTTAAGNIAAEAMPPDHNSITDEIESGTKGSRLNRDQTVSNLGTQHVGGAPLTVKHNTRKLPHFEIGDQHPMASGYIAHSFCEGLHPAEFFFHNLAGREGLIDTAVRTSDTGYLQRRLSKAMNDLRVTHGGTVQTSDGRLIQFRYGSDEFAGEHMERQKIPKVGASLSEFEAEYRWFPSTAKLQQEYATLIKCREFLAAARIFDTLVMPVPVARTLDNILRTWKQAPLPTNSHDDSTLQTEPDTAIVDPPADPPAASSSLKRPLDESCEEPTSPDEAPPKFLRDAELVCEAVEETLCTLVNMGEPTDSTFLHALRLLLASKPLLARRKPYTPVAAIRLLLEKVISAYEHSRSQPGEAVGSLAAQSMGEPSTQLTLNTFHTTGSVNETVSSGVPRMMEILNNCCDIPVPLMHLYLVPPFNQSKEAAQRVAHALMATSMDMLVSRAQIVYDPDPAVASHPDDVEWVDDWYALEDAPDTACEYSTLCLRFALRVQALKSRHWTASIVSNMVRTCFPALNIICTPDAGHVDNPVIRVRFPVKQGLMRQFKRKKGSKIYHEQMVAQELLQTMLDQSFGGIQDIVVAEAEEVFRNDWDPLRGHVTEGSEWGIVCKGSNLHAVHMLPEVDHSRPIKCNDVVHVYNVLGIEAARSVLFRELWTILTLDGSSYINHRHISLLVDTMTMRGAVMPVSRHGINRIPENTTLLKCSFEETLDMLLQAARFSNRNPIEGVVDNMLMGQPIPIGTNYSGVEIDFETLKQHAQRPKDVFVPNAADLFGDDSAWFDCAPTRDSQDPNKRRKRRVSFEETQTATQVSGRGVITTIQVPFS